MFKDLILNRLRMPSISQRILFAFAILLIISFTLSTLNIASLSEFNRSFMRYKDISEDTDLMLKVDKNISELQHAILIFTRGENAASMASLYNIHTELADDIRRLVADDSYFEETHKDKLTEMQNAVDQFREKLDTLEAEQRNRDLLVNTKLTALYEQLNSALEYQFLDAERIKDANLSALLWQSQLDISHAEVSIGRYFSKHNIQLRKDVENHIDHAGKTLKEWLATTANANNSAKITPIISVLAEFKAAFHQAVQADRNYLFLVNVVIAGESSELRTLSEQLKADALMDQEQLYKVSAHRIGISQHLLLYSSLFVAFLAMTIAWITGKRISRPLESITDTFSRLAKGENLSEIPGVERSDEIGRLAQAANVFRETNVRTQMLLEQTANFADELKKRECSLEEAVNKAQDASLAKSHFLANMSHELRTPMNAILGMIKLLRKTELNARQADYAIKTEGAAGSLLNLLNGILDLSKAEAGKMELDPLPFNIDELLRDLSFILSANLEEKPIDLQISIQPDLPRYFRGDAMRLQQILINLGGNAIKFTERGQVAINISSHQRQNKSATLTFEVKDSGIGIARENQEKIFSGFTQAEASTNRRFGGTGLGLAISQKLVGLMGGRIELESTLGEGSRFFFSVTLEALDKKEIAVFEDSRKHAASNTDQKRLDNMRILLVEDNLNNQQIAVELLQEEGAVVQIANHGQEAVDILRAVPGYAEEKMFSAVLMDLQMPVMDGLTATRIIRKELNMTDLPIIAMTANAMASDREDCLNAGMNEHVGKPFDLNHLISILIQHTGWRPSNRALPSENKPTSKLSEIAQHNGIDLNTALSLLGGREELYRRMLPTFIATLSVLPEQILSRYKEADLQGTARELHALKGMSAQMGLTPLANEAALVEKMLINEGLTVAARLSVDNICNSIKAYDAPLKKLLSAMQAAQPQKDSGSARKVG